MDMQADLEAQVSSLKREVARLQLAITKKDEVVRALSDELTARSNELAMSRSTQYKGFRTARTIRIAGTSTLGPSSVC